MSDSTKPVALINIVGLTADMLDERMPRLRDFAKSSCSVRPLNPVLPALTCSVQSSMLTGRLPAEHGIVGNGWYERDQAEIRFWKQSNHLVGGEKLWDAARDRAPGLTVANCFWWYAMHAETDITITPRPMYPSDGRKIPDIYTDPPDLRHRLQSRLGRFPLFNFWGPTASIASSRWIADAASIVHDEHAPDLLMVYLPHLDYDLQRYGPDHALSSRAMTAIDEVAGQLVDKLHRDGRRIVIVSEYGINPVEDAIHPNKVLRQAGLLRVRDELGRELLDPGGSDAFVVADHQIAHVYVRDPNRLEEVRLILGKLDGVASVLDPEGRREAGLDHPRSGDLILLSDRNSWFSWDYWLDESRAPDFARTVDIHRKPGYDPRELFFARGWKGSKPRLMLKLLAKKLGQRTLMDAIGLETDVVGGSHGLTGRGSQGILIREGEDDLPGELSCMAVHDIVLDELFRS